MASMSVPGQSGRALCGTTVRQEFSGRPVTVRTDFVSPVVKIGTIPSWNPPMPASNRPLQVAIHPKSLHRAMLGTGQLRRPTRWNPAGSLGSTVP